MDGYDPREGIKRQISYAQLVLEYGAEAVDELVELLTDIFCTTRPTLHIGGEERPTGQVVGRMKMLTYEHVKYVEDQLCENTTQIRNIRAYLLAMLYNAPATMSRYYQAEAQADLYGPSG